jgi:hypothetical protein
VPGGGCASADRRLRFDEEKRLELAIHAGMQLSIL